MKAPKPIAERMELIEGKWVTIKVYAPHENGTYETTVKSAKRRDSYQTFRSSQVLGLHP